MLESMQMADEIFTVRRMEEKDIDEWSKLRQHLWVGLPDAANTLETTRIRENFGSQLVLVAESPEGNLIGFLEASTRPFAEDCQTENVGYLEGWWIEPDYRRRGIGGKLVDSAERWARSKHCEEMASDFELGDDLSLAVHLKLGYQETSRLVHLRKELV